MATEILMCALFMIAKISPTISRGSSASFNYDGDDFIALMERGRNVKNLSDFEEYEKMQEEFLRKMFEGMEPPQNHLNERNNFETNIRPHDNTDLNQIFKSYTENTEREKNNFSYLAWIAFPTTAVILIHILKKCLSKSASRLHSGGEVLLQPVQSTLVTVQAMGSHIGSDTAVRNTTAETDSIHSSDLPDFDFRANHRDTEADLQSEDNPPAYSTVISAPPCDRKPSTEVNETKDSEPPPPDYYAVTFSCEPHSENPHE